ncbi:MAG: hypothetical protein M3Z57_02275 [Candidatus Dormibacteraeota bacterium]|nr:hypothetical protein [Candidatus Dormibacteraeota bacterium]
MPLNLAEPELPMALRACRSLLWAQAAYMLFAGIFVLLAANVLGGTIPFRDATVSGSGAAMLGIVYILAALTLTWLGVALGRRASWVRAATVSLEVFLLVVQLVRAFDLSLSTVINVALFVAVVALLFAPDTRRALEGPTQA